MMRAKQYLKQLVWINKDIKTKQQQLEELRSLAEKVTSAPRQDEAQATFADHDRTSSIVAKIVDLQEEINGEIDRLIDLRAEIITKINLVKREDCRILLTKRYINCLTWEQIAEDMGISNRWAYGGLHAIALQEFEKVYKNKSQFISASSC